MNETSNGIARRTFGFIARFVVGAALFIAYVLTIGRLVREAVRPIDWPLVGPIIQITVMLAVFYCLPMVVATNKRYAMTNPQPKMPKLIVVMAFDRNDDGELVTAFGPQDYASEERAVRSRHVLGADFT